MLKEKRKEKHKTKIKSNHDKYQQGKMLGLKQTY